MRRARVTDPRRTDEPPGPRIGRMARTLARRVQARAAGRLARPLLPRQSHDPHVGADLRRARSVPRELLALRPAARGTLHRAAGAVGGAAGVYRTHAGV